MSKKNKFDLTHLVKDGLIKEGEKIYYVSDSKMFGVIKKHPGGEYKVEYNKEFYTVHTFAQKCLQMDPPDHATKWFKTEKGQTLWDLWQVDNDIRLAA